MKKLIATIVCILGLATFSNSQTALEVVTKMNDNAFGGKMKSTMKMTIIRPKWTRTMEMKSWSDGDDFSLILITSPAREKGISYLKRKREMWNYQPSISRTIKMPPSMMSQSWMGSDFKNDDLVRQSSIVNDYSHKMLGKVDIDGRECYQIESVPKPDAPIIWGKVILWIDTKEYIQLKVENYDEDEELVQTVLGQDIKEMSGRMMATKTILIPADEEGHQTIMEYTALDLNPKIDDNFFSTQNMKRVR